MLEAVFADLNREQVNIKVSDSEFRGTIPAYLPNTSLGGMALLTLSQSSLSSAQFSLGFKFWALEL